MNTSLFVIASLGALSCLSCAESIWIEGENPTKSSMHRHPWWFDQVKKDLLSEADWISNFSKEEGAASYEFEAAEAGKYVLWIRACPTNTKLSFTIGGASGTLQDLGKEARGTQNIAADGKPDLRFIAWIKAPAMIDLLKGKNTITFRMHGGENNHGGLDCFCLSNDGFVPQGTLKPGAKIAAGPAEWFPLLVDEDTFSPESVIDMSGLVEAPAGKYGRAIPDRDRLVYEKRPGVPVKFWGCGANLEQDTMTKEKALRRIRYLKKFGINVVRQHPLFDEISTAGKVDAKKLDAYDWWFSELKKAGIYTDWSVFYHFPISGADGYPPELFAELEPMGGNLRDSYGLITISPQLWEIRNKVAVELLIHKNPYTGLRYAEEPALLAVEFQNEDSVFFWNPLGELANPNPKKWKGHARLLRQAFAAWVRKKYATDEALKKAWGKLDGESLANSELGLMGPWEMDGSGIRGKFAGQTQRAGDEIAFLTAMQLGFYRKAEAALRGTGYKGITITTNWLGGSNLLDQANIYTDTVGGMIDRHNYAGGGAGGHGIAEGQVYAGSHLPQPGSHLFSIALKQVENKPFSMTEWTMCPPTEWKLEAAPIFAFYGMGLQGWDCSYHFAQSGSCLGDGWPRMSSYVTDTPHYMGQFPALSFALAKGHIKEGPVVAARRTEISQVFSGKPAWLQDFYNGNELIKASGGTPMEVFAIGKVTVGFSGGKNEFADLEPFWSRSEKVVKSATGELVWDYGKEMITLATSKTQAIIGKAGGRQISLPGVNVKVKTPFISLIFTPLDDIPLGSSRRILVTAMARDRQTGAKYSDDGARLLSVGTAPLLLEPVQATLKFLGPEPASVRPLDPYGVPKKQDVPVASNGEIIIDGTYQAYYYEVKR